VHLYSITTNQEAIRALFRVMNRYIGNLPPMPGVFPRLSSACNTEAGSEMTLMRWGMPPPPRTGGPPVTNIRNISSPHWRGWLKPENRCLVPANSFAVVLIHTNRVAQGIAECERALALDRNLADAHAFIGVAKLVMGRGAETEAHVNEALRLSPRDIFAFRWLVNVGVAKLQLAADFEAVNWFLRGVEANRNWPFAHFGLAAALALLGKLDEAQAAAKTGLTLDPLLSVA
jgi:tetratricopeptide (TPR) repeat protein